MLARELDNPLRDWFNVFERTSAPIDGVASGPAGGPDVDVDIDGPDIDDSADGPDGDAEFDVIINYKI